MYGYDSKIRRISNRDASLCVENGDTQRRTATMLMRANRIYNCLPSHHSMLLCSMFSFHSSCEWMRCDEVSTSSHNKIHQQQGSTQSHTANSNDELRVSSWQTSKPNKIVWSSDVVWLIERNSFV